MGSAVTVADLDADGRDDVYVADRRPDVVWDPSQSDPVFLRGIGGNAFATARSDVDPAYGETRPTAVDRDGDGKLDMVTAGSYAGQYAHLIRYGLGAQLMPTEDELDFEPQAVGTASASRRLTFTNAGGGVAYGIEAATGGDTPDFPVELADCATATLAIGESCTVSVRFTPAGDGYREAMLALIGADSDLGWIAWLTGDGFTPVPAQPTPAPAPPHVAVPAPRPPLRLDAATVTRTTRGALSRHGLRVLQSFPTAGRVRWSLELTTRGTRLVLGTASRRIGHAGIAAVTIRLSASGRSRLARRHPRTLTLRTAFTDTTGRSTQRLTAVHVVG